MRLRRGLVAFTAMATIAACGGTSEVRTGRADPITKAPVSSDAPDDTKGPSDSTPSTDPTATNPTDGTASSTGTLQWGRCDDPNAEDPSLECATLRVPLDYDNPTGDGIDMALIKYPATGDRTGAVLFNPGGPGASGFDAIAFSGALIAAELSLESLDLIGFDPRGVDRSGGIQCVSDEFQDQHLYVDDTPDTPEEQALKEESTNGFVDGCKQVYGDTLRFYSTANTARDMDAIRAALGDDQLSFLGASYGTYLGATYATMFPDRVRAMVLDSVFEPNGDTVEERVSTQLIGFEGAFDNWAAWCTSDAACAFTADDVGARWDALKQQLDDTPLPGADGRLANNATMHRATQAALYSESDWPVLARALAKAEVGDPAALFALADGHNGRNEDGTFDTLFQSLPVIQCASGIGIAMPDDPEALAATLRSAAPRFGKGITAEDLTAPADTCNQLVGHVEQAALSYAGAGPILVVGGTNDPATPIRWAEKMVGELGPNAQLVTSTGEGHGQLVVNTCVTRLEGALLTDLKLPAPDTVCGPNPVVEEPSWWDDLPVPEGMSEVTELPALAAILGASPTMVFSEMRTTSLSAMDAVAAYTAALRDEGVEEFDAPAILPVDDTAQGAYSDFGDRTIAVVAIGPKAFDDKALQSAKSDVPADTTVVWIVAIVG